MTRRWWAAAWAVLVLIPYGAAAQSGGHVHGAEPARPAPAPAARTAPALPAGEVPLQCWWRPSKGAIHVGEILDVVLTCSALESDVTRAVPDETRLTVAAVQMAPWEIVGGSHPADTRSGTRRIFQYVYQLRMLDANAIGRDVKLPPLAIPFRIQSRMGAQAALSGRDMTHQMPQIPVRVVGQVPFEASDIRDGSTASLAEIAALRFRANAFRTAGTVLMVLAGVAVLASLLPLAGRLRTARVRTPGRASDRAVLTWAASRLETLAGEARGGWTAEALREAHAAARIVAGTVVGAGVRQRRLAAGDAVPDGRLLLERRFGRLRTAVTASTTAGDVARAIASLPDSAGGAERAALERLRDALSALARAQFARDEAAAAAAADAIDGAVQAVREVGRDTARRQLWSWRSWRRPQPAGPAPLEF